MASQPFSEMTTEQLKTREKQMKVAVYVMAICVGLMFIMSIIMLVTKKGTTINMVMPVFFLPLLLINVSTLKKITAEIKSRGQN